MKIGFAYCPIYHIFAAALKRPSCNQEGLFTVNRTYKLLT
jgi:hypothetical protein